MKKTLISILTLLFVMVIAGTAFATPMSPFSDVPAKHWAYDAVAKLAKDGLVEGDNGRFAGERILTRYEMAQVIANAMTKIDQADATAKASIEKLQAEFATELSSLGVRVAKLEKKPSSFAISGDVRLRYRSNADQSATNLSTNTKSRFDSRARVMFSDEDFAPNLSYYGRLQSLNNTKNQDANSTLNKSVTGALSLDRFEIDWKNANTTVQLGRYAPNLGPSILVWSPGFPIDGINFIHKTGKLTATAGYADLAAAFDNAAGVTNSKADTVTAQLASMQYDFTKGANVSLAYLNSMRPDASVAGSSNGYMFKQLDLTTSVKTGNFTVLLEGIKNLHANLPTNAEKTGFYSRLQYKNLNLQKPGSTMLFIDYMKLGNWAVDSSAAMNNLFGCGGNGIGRDGAQGYGGGFANTIAKNCDITFAAFWLKPYDAARTGAAFTRYKPSFQAWTNFRF